MERKLGLTGMSQIAIDANSFYDAKWAHKKVYMPVCMNLRRL